MKLSRLDKLLAEIWIVRPGRSKEKVACIGRIANPSRHGDKAFGGRKVCVHASVVSKTQGQAVAKKGDKLEPNSAFYSRLSADASLIGTAKLLWHTTSGDNHIAKDGDALHSSERLQQHGAQGFWLSVSDIPEVKQHIQIPRAKPKRSKYVAYLLG